MITYPRALILISVFFGCTCIAMEQVTLPRQETEADAHEERLLDELVLQENPSLGRIDPATLAGLPADVWKLTLINAASNNSIPTLFSQIAKWRSINRNFNKILHDTTFLQKLFSKVLQRAAPMSPTVDAQGSVYIDRAKAICVKYLSSYLGLLLSKIDPSEKERMFLKIVQGNQWQWDELFNCLITPGMTVEELSQNIPLTGAATIFMGLSDKNTPEQKQQWIQTVQQIALKGVTQGKQLSKDTADLMEDVGILHGNEIRTTELFSQGISSELSYMSLQQVLLQKGLISTSWRSLLKLPACELLNLLCSFMLSTDQKEVLTACYTGDLETVTLFLPSMLVDQKGSKATNEYTLVVPRKRQGGSPVVLDLMLLLALKGKHKDIALHIMAANSLMKRDWASINFSAFYCSWMLCEALKLADKNVCSSLVHYVFQALPAEFLANPLFPITTLIQPLGGIISSIDEIDIWCTLLDSSLQAVGLPVAQPQPFMKACFLQDTDAIARESTLMKDIDWLALVPVLILLAERNLVKTLQELLKIETARAMIIQSKDSLIMLAERDNHPEIAAILRTL